MGNASSINESKSNGVISTAAEDKNAPAPRIRKIYTPKQEPLKLKRTALVFHEDVQLMKPKGTPRQENVVPESDATENPRAYLEGLQEVPFEQAVPQAPSVIKALISLGEVNTDAGYKGLTFLYTYGNGDYFSRRGEWADVVREADFTDMAKALSPAFEKPDFLVRTFISFFWLFTT